MNARTLKDKLIKGETIFGTFFVHSLDPTMVEDLPTGALDFVIFSSEHTALELAEFLPVRQALKAKGIASLVRIHSRDADDVAKACDSYDGVVVPYVEDYEQARRLAAAAVYRPLKGEALERVLTKGEWPSKKTQEYIKERNAGTVFIPMIESVAAIKNLDAICTIPGVDAVFIGPGDLTVNMGIPQDYDHPDLIAAIKQVIDTAAKHHVAAGSWFGDRRRALRTIRQGARLVVYANDGALLREAMDSTFTELRKG